LKISIPAASGRSITKFSPSDQVLLYSWNPRSKLRGILLRRIKEIIESEAILTLAYSLNFSFIQEIRSASQEKIIQPVQVGQAQKQNELVFFVKPELLDVTDDIKVFNSLQLIHDKFQEFNVKIDGVLIIPGAVLEKHAIMDRHYGFINQLSRKASRIVDPETRQRLFAMLNKKDTGTHSIYGGHEFLDAFRTDIKVLSDVWFAQEAKKLRSGFYFIEDRFQGEPIILINGFHPSQLEHFTREDHRIVLMLLHTDTPWNAMKFDLVGDTFPQRAKPDSIRGRLFAEPERYGQKEVGINTNGVHLSAGPFEAAFEVVNFCGAVLGLTPEKTKPLAIKRAMKVGISQEDALTFLDNPPLNNSDLFTETENMNTDEAVIFAKDQLQ